MTGSSHDRTAVLLHGWPGLPSDFDAVVGRLGTLPVVTPDLRGFGAGYAGPIATSEATADAYASRLLRELDARGITDGVVIAGYDIGSRIAQAALRLDPARFDGAVLTPGYPGIGERAADPALASVFWYQHFHREPVAAQLIDGDEVAVRRYLAHIWTAWRGPDTGADHPHLDEIVAAYSRPGAFAASLQWYVANRGYAAGTAPIATPTTMLWPTDDPLFPTSWADRLDEHFTDVDLSHVERCGHFVPIEQPDRLARAILRLAAPVDQ